MDFIAWLPSITMAFISEIGDKTFFINLILATNKSRVQVFGGAVAAAILMTILSAFCGIAASYIIQGSLTTIFSSLLFMIFGVMSVYDFTKGKNVDLDSYINGLTKKYIKGKTGKIMNVFVLTFMLNFFLEWGDRSQVVTAAMVVT